MPRKTAPHRGAADRRLVASMRPRPDAAENFHAAGTPEGAWPGFNEAAARCRGKPAARGRRRRPRGSFNEAAARCRGKLLKASLFAGAPDRLQ